MSVTFNPNNLEYNYLKDRAFRNQHRTDATAIGQEAKKVIEEYLRMTQEKNDK